MESYKCLIIGGGLAGGRAVDGIRQVDPQGSVALVTQEPHLPYERPPLSKEYLRGEVDLDRVYVDAADTYADRRVDVLTGVRATGVNPHGRTVTLDDGRTLAYEKLLLATGGCAWRLPIPGADLKNVFTLRTIEDSDAIPRGAGDGAHALVMGGASSAPR
ncbi:MAG: FAD-dependent oxidoreductase [Chloroflexota bacterium]|nr:FAD-dependent oxidoreductase [Chloroflexota bacterium]